MWHTTEIVKIFEQITDQYGYEIYENRKLCVALCNDLLAAYTAEKNILQMLFQAGLGEAMKGVPYKSDEELNRGLTTIDKFMIKQAIDSKARGEVLEFISQTFALEGVKISGQSFYQPTIQKKFDGLHFKMTLPVLKEFTDRVDASFRFMYNNQETAEITTVLEQCKITSRTGKVNSSRMDYTLFQPKKMMNATIGVSAEDNRLFLSGAEIAFVFLCSNRKKIVTSYRISTAKTAMLNLIAVSQMTEAEHKHFLDIVNLLRKPSDNAGHATGEETDNKTGAGTSNNANSNSNANSSYTGSMGGGPFYTSSDIKDYSDALRNEILFLKQGKGRKYKIVNGQKLNRDDKGIYTYSFEMETELHLPDDAPVVVEASGGLRAIGSVLSCEDFQMLLLLDRDLNDRVSSAHLMVEPWKLLEALDKRINSLNPNVNQLAIKIMKKGPALSTDDNIANVPKGQKAVMNKLEREDIVAVWGPPGTGKTYTMANIAKEYLAKNKSVLIVSHSNVSVDGVIKKVVSLLDTNMRHYLKEGKVLRCGYVRDEELSKHPYATSFNYTLGKCISLSQQLDNLTTRRDDLRAKKQTKSKEYDDVERKIKKIRSEIKKEEKTYVQRAQVIGTTISKATVDPIFEERQFDLVMFDEVSMAYVPQVIAAAALAKEKFMCVGDFRQLAPISQSPAAKLLQVDIFSYLQIVDARGNMFWHPWLVMLNEQRRMAPAIAEFPNRYVYNQLLRDHSSVLHARDNIIMKEPLAGHAMNLVDLAGTYCAADVNTDRSRFNILSAVVSFSTAVKAVQNKNESVGIITPYAAQTRLIRAMIKDYYGGTTSAVSCATVHQFQGSESDVIVFDAVESYPKKAVGYLMGKDLNQVTRLINVAITRGKGKVITVANARFWENVFKGTNHILYKLLQYIKRDKQQVVDQTSKKLTPYIEDINPQKMIHIFTNEREAIEAFKQDIRKTKSRIVVSMPSGNLRETESQIFTLLDDADSQGIDVLVKSNDYKSLPEHWKDYCWETENATFPLILLDDEVAWYGLPTAQWKFQVDKSTSLITVVHAMVRIKGKNTVEMIRSLTNIETVVSGNDVKTIIPKKKAVFSMSYAVAGSGKKDKSGVMGSRGLAAFVEQKEFCPDCKKPMVLAKNGRGTAYLKCSSSDCKKTKYLDKDIINWYIDVKSVECPKNDGGTLRGGLGKYGPYVRCSCGHYLKPDEI